MTEPIAARSVTALESRLELSAPATPEIMDLVHVMLEHLWGTASGISDRDRVRFEMSVIEILGNVVEHAYAADNVDVPGHEGRRFEIVLGVTDEALMAHLADNGLPTALDLSGVAMPDELAESGRGLALATAALDELSYERVEDRNLWDLLCLRVSSD
ncbi:anti-sigma regulatory factor [Nocardioides szechwanensis]|uniref:Serine/threonine-protein kinase RsbW n=1 Tax=Nocardioides szechwanensis TaxID=1005944 RepID=A0A1G9WAN8_9ACTN|nr:ATP-binding protein [Nocardioides szechwanensis]GEP32688.1 anti-sigma regulatory factor [Nocardioides szechwanensis]SDM81582.1 serine/threonine-protein kinase RsbW [Nocardioides szechwanensis]